MITRFFHLNGPAESKAVNQGIELEDLIGVCGWRITDWA